jgi:transcription antitermination factor NusG
MSCIVEPLLNHISTQSLALGNCRHWYALYTYLRHEKNVLAQFESSSVEAFPPTVVSKNRWKYRCARVEASSFPGYVFIRINLCGRNKAFAIPCVIPMPLSINGTPAPVDDLEMKTVKPCLEGGTVLEPYPSSKLEIVSRYDRVRFALQD